MLQFVPNNCCQMVLAAEGHETKCYISGIWLCTTFGGKEVTGGFGVVAGDPAFGADTQYTSWTFFQELTAAGEVEDIEAEAGSSARVWQRARASSGLPSARRWRAWRKRRKGSASAGSAELRRELKA